VLVGRAERFLRIDTDRGKIRRTLVQMQMRDPDTLAASVLGAWSQLAPGFSVAARLERK